MKKAISYFVIAVLFWFAVDFSTTEAVRNPAGYYGTYMPALLFFYIGSPLLFSFLIYRFKLDTKWLFGATLVTIFIVEILFTHNALLYTFPLLFLTIPVAISIYSMLTFVPKWLVEGKIKEHWKIAALMGFVYLLVSLATIFKSS